MAYKVCNIVRVGFLPYPHNIYISAFQFYLLSFSCLDSDFLSWRMWHFNSADIFSSVIHYDTSFFSVSSIFNQTIGITSAEKKNRC